MLAVTDPTVQKITVMCCTQLLKTELLNNVIGYHIDQDPAPIILMQPTVAMAQAYSKDRLDPMIADSPVLREAVSEKKSRDSQNTILHKSFAGGQISLIGSNSPSELASRPVRTVLADEVDRYPASAGDEGDPINLIIERTATFFNKKIIMTSSPTIKGRSRIEHEYELSDKRVYVCPCPKCEVTEELKFENVKWFNDDAKTAHYECPECKHQWTEVERRRAIKKGYYIATAPFNGHAGFKVNKIASPWEPLSVLVQKYLECKDDVEKLKTFVNTQLAESFEEKGEAPEHKRLYERRELYKTNTVPMGVIFLTAGVDVQKDRLEVEIVGWGIGKESWSIDYRVIMGETAVLNSGPWLELDKLLNETWQASRDRELQVRVLAVDSGYNTSFVYNWARKYPSSRVMVVKGNDSIQNVLGTPQAADINHAGNKIKRSVKVWPVGVSNLKTELYGFLNLDSAGDDGVYPPGFCHFPQYDEEYFKQLTAEQLMKRKVNGKTVYLWVKTRERNEVLDCRNYARAAASMFGMDRFKPSDWNQLYGMYFAESTVKEREPIQQEKPTQPVENPFWKNSGRKNFW